VIGFALKVRAVNSAEWLGCLIAFAQLCKQNNIRFFEMISRNIFLFSLVTWVAFTGCKRADDSSRPATAQVQPVEVVAVKRRDLSDTLSVVGSLAANESASIRAEIAGQVRGVFFEEGQRVTKGQVLLKIDDSELRAQFAQSEARFKLAELSLARNESLVESHTISQADYDRARAEFSASSGELSVLRVRLEKTEIKAPFDGVVGSRSVSPGDYVTQSSNITQIDDLSRLKIDFQVPERFLSKLESGLRFHLRSKTLDAASQVQGEVYFVSSVIDRLTRSSEVKGFLNNPPPQLRSGMFANIELVLEVHKNVLTAPEGAILTVPGGSQVIAVRDAGTAKIAEFIPVQLGMRAKGVVEITPLKSDLAEGQSIVAAGVGALIIFPGTKLEPRPIREEFRIGN
jgi:membrane fusion protein (multidrug efflux system)